MTEPRHPSNLATFDRVNELLAYGPFDGLLRCGKGRQGIRAGAVAGSLLADGYVRLKIDGKQYLAHRVAHLLMTGRWPEKNPEHRNRIRSDIQHYQTLSFDELAAFPVADLAAEDCALFLWTVRSNLPEALRLIEAWNFTFKTTGFVWVKCCHDDPARFRIGLGHWTRTQTESCWIATRGKPRRIGKGVREMIIAPPRAHSQKPDETYGRIEALVAGPYLELFARQERTGWDCHGDEIGDKSPAKLGCAVGRAKKSPSLAARRTEAL